MSRVKCQVSSGGERRTGREVVHGGRERPVPAPRGALGQALLRAGAARHRDARRARTARRPLPHTTHHTHSYIQGRIQGGHGRLQRGCDQDQVDH